MLYKLAHIILTRFPWLWECIEWLNDLLFKIRYHKSIATIDGLASAKDADALVSFLERQPISSFEYFRPHLFDTKSVTKLLRRTSMFMHVISRDGGIVGYCFLRCFFIGKGYRGYIVDANQQKKGIGKELGQWLNDTAKKLPIRTFKTINKNNAASLRLAQATCKLIKIQELEKGDIEYECLIL